MQIVYTHRTAETNAKVSRYTPVIHRITSSSSSSVGRDFPQYHIMMSADRLVACSEMEKKSNYTAQQIDFYRNKIRRLRLLFIFTSRCSIAFRRYYIQLFIVLRLHISHNTCVHSWYVHKRAYVWVIILMLLLVDRADILCVHEKIVYNIQKTITFSVHVIILYYFCYYYCY